MKRKNTTSQTLNSGIATIDTGDGVLVEVPIRSKIATEAYSDLAAEGVKWGQGGMLATAQINGSLGAVKDGQHWATSDTRAGELNLPDSRAGVVTQVSSGTFGLHVYESLLGTSIRLWSDGSQSWGAWTNPANKYTDAAVAAVKWYHGGLTATAPINGPLGAVLDGEWRVTSDARAVELNLPSGRAGDFKQISYGTFGFHVYETLVGTFKRLWSDETQTWGAWGDPASLYTDAVVAAALGEAKSYTDEANKPSSGNKLVPLILTAGHGGQNYGMTTGTVRHPMWWGAPIFRARVHIRNINPRENQVRTGAVNFPQGLYIGDATTWDGTATNLRQIAAPFTTPENGDGWVSDWFDFDAAADSKHVLSAAFTATGTVVANAGACWTSPGAVADSTAGTWTQANMSPFDIWIEAETPATTPTVAMVSDSTGAGSGATFPVLDSVLSQHMRAWGGLPIHYTHVGDSFHSYNGGGAAGSEDYKKDRWLHLARPDAAVLGLGNNDIFGVGKATLATMQSRYTQTAEWMLQALSPTLFLTTVTPRDLETGASEDVRRAYNPWLKEQTRPSGAARGVFDFSAAVSSDNETIDAPYNADGIHLTTAGYAAEAETLRNLTSPAVMYRSV